MLAAALEAVTRFGCPAFLVKPRTKAVPIGDLRELTLTTDPDVLRQHFAAAPYASYALVCGTVPGLAVLDVDGPQGWRSLARLVDQHGPLEIGPAVATPGTDGMHYYFVSPGLPKNIMFKPGLDWLDVGQAVMGAGSVHKNGRLYEYVIGPDEPLVSPPAWLIDLVRKPTFVPATASVVTRDTAYARVTRCSASARRWRRPHKGYETTR